MFLGLAVSLAACGHSDPAGGADLPVVEGPHAAAVPTRLTYDGGMDQVAGVSTDGGTLLYMFQPEGRADRDRCLGFMPIEGGTREEFCDDAAAEADRTNSLEMPALDADGRLLYAEYTSAIGAPLPSGGALRLATRASPGTARTLLVLPATIGTLGIDHIGTMRWRSATTFYVNVGLRTLVGNSGNPNKKDTLVVGLAIVRGDLTETGATFTPIAGSEGATGFDFSVAGDSLYLTVEESPSLFAIAIEGGARRTVYTEPRLLDSAMVVVHPVRTAAGLLVVREMKQDRARLGVRFPPVPPPLGLMPWSGLRVIRPDGSTTLLANMTAQPLSGGLVAFGRLVAPPGGCAVVAEHRYVRDLSFTTDLYRYCVDGTTGSCGCP